MSQADVPIDPDATRIRTAAGHCFRYRSDNVLLRPEIAIVANSPAPPGDKPPGSSWHWDCAEKMTVSE